MNANSGDRSSQKSAALVAVALTDQVREEIHAVFRGAGATNRDAQGGTERICEIFAALSAPMPATQAPAGASVVRALRAADMALASWENGYAFDSHGPSREAQRLVTTALHDFLPAAQGHAAVADWNNRETKTPAGWVNELLTLAEHRNSALPTWARSAMRTIAQGLHATLAAPMPAGAAVGTAPAGLPTLLFVISELRSHGAFNDEEGELTDRLEEVAQWVAATTPTTGGSK